MPGVGVASPAWASADDGSTVRLSRPERRSSASKLGSAQEGGERPAREVVRCQDAVPLARGRPESPNRQSDQLRPRMAPNIAVGPPSSSMQSHLLRHLDSVTRQGSRRRRKFCVPDADCLPSVEQVDLNRSQGAPQRLDLIPATRRPRASVDSGLAGTSWPETALPAVG